MLPLIPIIGLIGSALAIGAVVYLAVKLTVSFLKKYKQKKNSKIMAAQVKDLIKNAPTMSLDDLDDDEPVAGIIDEFAKRNGMSIESYELLHKCNAGTRKRVSEATKTLFSKAVGTEPTEMDEAKVFCWIVDENRKVSNDKIYILTCAFYRAADAGHKGQWNYIEAILYDMHSKGVKTKEDAMDYFYSRKDDA